MMAHRPLSAWIAAAELSADGTARWDYPPKVNFGDERADARALPEFAADWQRRAVTLDPGYLALGLVREGSRAAVIELDNYARPVRVSEAAAGVISRAEDAWPNGALSSADLAVLAGEDRAVRYLVADRLAAEGDPPPELFHVLPWELVDELAGQVTAMLDGVAPPAAVIELGHWFGPAGSRFTAALEQLDEGLRNQDPALVRDAVTALSGRLLVVDRARLPGPTREALARLARRLAQPGRLIDSAVRQRLTQADLALRGAEGAAPGPAAGAAKLAWGKIPTFSLPVPPESLALAAADPPGGSPPVARTTSPDGLVTYLLYRRGGGEYWLEVSLAQGAAATPVITIVNYTAEAPGGAGDSEQRWLLVPLNASDGGPSSSLVRLPRCVPGSTLEGTSPVAPANMPAWDDEVIAVSVAAALNGATLRAWHRVAELAPPDVRQRITDALSEAGE